MDRGSGLNIMYAKTQTPLASVEQECWTMYFDGSLMKSGARAGLVFVSPSAHA
jgi:hypothetical protein